MGPQEEVKIERLAPAQLDELILAQNDIFSDYIIPIRSTPEFFTDYLRSVGGDLGSVLVALKDGKIVGYANPVIDGKEAWIGGLGVRPPFRSRGIGAKLMSAAEDMCRKRGAQTVLLEVIEGNTRAQGLYERLGYRPTKKFITAEGRAASFDGFGKTPKLASLSEIMAMHEKAYAGTCWQRRKRASLIQSAKGGQCYRVEGGFVITRNVDTNGFVPFLGVLPEARGRGIGTDLARFALSKLADSGVYKVAVYNLNEDLPIVRLLDKFDFKVTMKQLEMSKRI